MEKEALLYGSVADVETSYVIVDFPADLDDVGSGYYHAGGRGGLEAKSTHTGLASGSTSRKHDGISNAETVVHIIKGNIGTGLIGLPFAFMHAGFAVGLATMAVICVVAVWCMLMLVKASRRLCELHGQRKLDYASTAELGIALVFPTGPWSQVARWVVNGFLIITQLGFTAIYFVFISQNMQQVFLALRIDLNYHLLICIFTPILVVGVWIRDLKTTAIFSGLGTLLQVISVVIIVFYVAAHLDWGGVRLYPKKVTNMALFFGLACFSVEGIGVVMPLENDMKKPRHFPALLVSSMSFVSTLFLLVGSLGFVCFGDDTKGSITLNMPGGATEPRNIPFIYVKLFYSFAIMSSFLVQFYVAIEIIEPYVCSYVRASRQPVTSYVLRAGLVCAAAGLAAGVPNLGLFISLVGAFGSSTLALIFPSLIHLAVFWHSPGLLWKLRNWIIAVVGVLGMASGTYATVVQLVKKL